jgi:branched-subunit amino acid ABC-type transport system permease component
MHMLDTWEQTAVFNPADPTQKKIEKYAGIPGAYASFYFNRVPNPGTLQGPFTSGVATGAGLFVGLAIAGVGIGVASHLFARARGKKHVAGLAGWRRIFSRMYKKRRRR